MKQEKNIVIIDYESGNIHSVFNALDKICSSNDKIQISDNPKDLKSASHIILPGVGAFGDCISSLRKISNMVEELQVQVVENKKPFLGICVGMQILADFGIEYEKYSGLGFISGDVIPIPNPNHKLKIPHIGWNNIHIKKQHPIFKDISEDEHFYFVHSYHFIAKNSNHILATVDYGNKINAIIAKNNIIATQFHPEKSSEAGLRLLKNFTNINFL